ncbi:MAG: hypothetical protein JW910_21615 [Anaerolineae bacterium]|nr:hypothetical protein [Anaerolineae bacterium]
MKRVLRYLLVGVLAGIATCFLCVATVWLIWQVRIQQRVQRTAENSLLDDSVAYVVEFAVLLGPEWQATAIYRPDEDIMGWHWDLAGVAVQGTRHRDNELAGIGLNVYTYVNEDAARERYDEIEEWAIVYMFGVPPSRQSFPNQDIALPGLAPLHANEHRIVCSQIPVIETKCKALLRYGNHIVWITAYLIRNSTLYLTQGDFAAIINAVDVRMMESPASTPAPTEN